MSFETSRSGTNFYISKYQETIGGLFASISQGTGSTYFFKLTTENFLYSNLSGVPSTSRSKKELHRSMTKVSGICICSQEIRSLNGES
jgi:hypothetical protein